MMVVVVVTLAEIIDESYVADVTAPTHAGGKRDATTYPVNDSSAPEGEWQAVHYDYYPSMACARVILRSRCRFFFDNSYAAG